VQREAIRMKRNPETLSAPAIAGDRWSSRSERTVVEGRMTRRWVGVARQASVARMNEVKSGDQHQSGAIVPGFRCAHPGYKLRKLAP
jgi:hypothetical protein